MKKEIVEGLELVKTGITRIQEELTCEKPTEPSEDKVKEVVDGVCEGVAEGLESLAGMFKRFKDKG